MDPRSPPLEPELAEIFTALHGAGWFDTVRRSPLDSPDSATGAAIDRMSITVNQEVYSYVIKRIAPLGDWLARATDDLSMREHQLAAGGVFTELPAGVASATIASARTATGAAIVMRDVSAWLSPSGSAPLSPRQLRVSLAGLARMHSAFVGFSALRAEQLGLNRLETWLTPLSFATARREERQPHRDPFTPIIVPGWQAFAELEPQAWELIGSLLAEPQPLAEALRQFEPTLVHGDVKAANFAVEGDTLILLDWSATTVGPGALDLAWYLCINAHKLPCSKDDAIDIYRAERRRLGVLPWQGDEWERELTMALLTSPMRLGWLRGYNAVHAAPDFAERERAEVAYWAERALAARTFI